MESVTFTTPYLPYQMHVAGYKVTCSGNDQIYFRIRKSDYAAIYDNTQNWFQNVISTVQTVAVTCPSNSYSEGTDITCILYCSNGVRGIDEECDDGNAIDGDGCSSACTIESGYN